MNVNNFLIIICFDYQWEEKNLKKNNPMKKIQSNNQRKKNNLKRQRKLKNPRLTKMVKKLNQHLLKSLLRNRKKMEMLKKKKLSSKRKTKRKIFYPGKYFWYCRQKFPTPNEDDGARAFYTSLYRQNPKSEMARKYCL